MNVNFFLGFPNQLLAEAVYSLEKFDNVNMRIWFLWTLKQKKKVSSC